MFRHVNTTALVLMLLGSWLFIVPAALADPPPWAPAHGYRAKKEKGHGKHKKHRDPADASYAEIGNFGIDLGTCNREQIGQLLGGAAGGAVGSTIGKGDGKTVAVIAGTIIGFVVGGNIGRAMDEIDQHCAGQALERADTGQSVRWQNPDGERYSLTPTRTFEREGRYCREYSSTGTVSGQQQTLTGVACRDAAGRWELVS